MVTSSSSFFSKLAIRMEKVDSLLCVGLDPHIAELGDTPSAEKAFEFCRSLIENTKHIAACYKPNAAFFEQFGFAGWDALDRVCKLIPNDIPVIFDAKRGDIGSTSAAYAIGTFNYGSAVTISPYLGSDGIEPFVNAEEKSAFVLCKTSNPGSNDLQKLIVEGTGEPLFMKVAELCHGWGKQFNNVGVVVGATDVDAIAKIRKKYEDMWFLSPGIGAQGGPLREALLAGMNKKKVGMLIPISRGISKAVDQKTAADEFHRQINEIRYEVPN